MRVLISGANGFVGRYAVSEALARGHQVTALTRNSTDSPAELRADGVTTVVCDLRAPGPELARELARCDAVIHLAATIGGSPRSRFDGTVLATERLIGAMHDVGWRGRFVHVSSFAVYGFNQLSAGSIVNESTPLEPHLERRDDYAWVKAWQERLVRELRDDGEVDVVIVRPGAVYGRERQFQQRLGRMLGQNTLLLLGGRSRMPLTYVENAASLMIECATNPHAVGETFNVVDPKPLRQWQYLRRWRRAQPNKVRVLPLPRAVHRGLGQGLQLASVLSHGRTAPPGLLDPYLTTPNLRSFRFETSRAARLLDWRPPFTREEALARTFGRAHRRPGGLAAALQFVARIDP